MESHLKTDTLEFAQIHAHTHTHTDLDFIGHARNAMKGCTQTQQDCKYADEAGIYELSFASFLLFSLFMGNKFCFLFLLWITFTINLIHVFVFLWWWCLLIIIIGYRLTSIDVSFFVLINKLAKCSFCLFVVVLNSLLILVLVLLLLFLSLQSENANIREFASSPLTHRHPTTIRVCFSTRDNCETSQRKLTSTKFQEHVWSLTLAHTRTHSKTSNDIQTDVHRFTCNSTCS